MEETTTWFLDQKIGDGQMDMVLDFANPVPAVITMQLIGLPCDQWARYAEVFHGTVAYGTRTPEHRQVVALIPGMVTELVAAVEERKRKPQADILTELTRLRLDDGRLLTDEQIGSVLWNLVGGGLDTTTSLTSLALHHLNSDAGARRRLVENPDLLPTATEEYPRFFCVNETLTRTAVLSAPLGSGPIASGAGHSPWCRGGDGWGRVPRSLHVPAKAVSLIGKVPRSVSVSSVDAEIATDANSPRRGTKPR
jgi:cytochrome P450